MLEIKSWHLTWGGPMFVYALISSYKIGKYLCIYEDSFGVKILRFHCNLKVKIFAKQLFES